MPSRTGNRLKQTVHTSSSLASDVTKRSGA
jgi:hypothetical protein